MRRDAIASAGLLLISDGRGDTGRTTTIVGEALDAGLKALQLREKTLSALSLLRLAESLRRRTADYGALLLVNDRLDVALAVGADGVHLGLASLPPAEVRGLVPDDFLIGASTHSTAELSAAETGGADYAVFGPVFATPSKKPYGPPVGRSALAEAAWRCRLPLFALGGITARRVGEVMKAGARGVALISAVFEAPEPAAAVRRLLAAIKGERP